MVHVPSSLSSFMATICQVYLSYGLYCLSLLTTCHGRGSKSHDPSLLYGIPIPKGFFAIPMSTMGWVQLGLKPKLAQIP